MASWPQKYWQSAQDVDRLQGSDPAVTDRNDEDQAEALDAHTALRARKRKQPDDGEPLQYAHDAGGSAKSSAASFINDLHPVAAMHDQLDEEIMVSLSHEDTGLFGGSMEAGLQGLLPSPAGPPAFAGPLELGGEHGIASDTQTASVPLASSIASVASPTENSEDKNSNRSAGSNQTCESSTTIEAFISLAEQNHQSLRKLKSLVALDCDMTSNSTSRIGGQKCDAAETNESSSASATNEGGGRQFKKHCGGVGIGVVEAATAQNPIVMTAAKEKSSSNEKTLDRNKWSVEGARESGVALVQVPENLVATSNFRVEKMLVPASLWGAVIGRGGETIIALQKASKARILTSTEGQEHLLICGETGGVSRCVRYIKNVRRVWHRIAACSDRALPLRIVFAIC
eukprot:SAG31_NODE_3323_length_4411_cov_1.853432_2_plen_400_part_00